MRQLLELKWRLLPLLAAIAIICIPFIEGFWSKHQVTATAEAAEAVLESKPSAPKIEGIPTRIVIPSLAIDLPVVTQTYSERTKTWPVSAHEANYASNTTPANNTHGETLIYGHNNRQVFGPLLNMHPGDLTYVYTNNGHVFKYSYIASYDISPNKLSIFSDMAAAAAGLKLITCNGPYFEYRHLMSFRLIQAS